MTLPNTGVQAGSYSGDGRNVYEGIGAIVALRDRKAGGTPWSARFGTVVDVLLLRWLTGEDGLPAFWKLAHIVNTSLFALTVFGCWQDHVLQACMGWLVLWGTMLQFMALGIKGAQLYAKYFSKQVTGAVTTQATIAEQVTARRDYGLGFGGDAKP